MLPLVVRAGAGSVRDSLSVLDQLLGGADESGVGYRQATALLGYTPDSLLDEFVDAFAAGDAGGVFSCVDKVIEVGQDPRRFAEDLLRRLRDLVIVAAVPDALTSGLVDAAGDQGERLSSQAAALGPGELTRAAEVLAVGLTEMRGTTAPRLHLELMCARVVLPGADVDGRGIHARLDRIERRLGVVGGDGAARGAGTRPPPPLRRAQGTCVLSLSKHHASRPALRQAQPGASRQQAEPDDFRGPAGGETDDTALGATAEEPAAPPPAAAGHAARGAADGDRRTPALARGARGGQGQAPVHLDPAEPERPGDRAAGQHLAARHVQRGARGTASAAGAARTCCGRRSWSSSARISRSRPWSIRAPRPATAPRTPAAGRARGSRPRARLRPSKPSIRRIREQARQSIRPTRTDPGGAKPKADDRDADARRDDSDLDDAAESPADLLARHLDAEIITEDESPT